MHVSDNITALTDGLLDDAGTGEKQNRNGFASFRRCRSFWIAITPAAGYVSIGESIFIGTVASVISNLCVHWKNKASTLDDTLDVFPCHGVGGMVGMLMTGVFTKDVGLTSGHAYTFFIHCGALVFVAAFSFGGSYLLYKLTDLIIPLRVSADQEALGLDLSQHGEVIQETVTGSPELVLAKTA